MLEQLATKDHPLRISALTGLSQCPLITTVKAMKIIQDTGSSQPADTGSALGRAIELYHCGELPETAFKRVTAERNGLGGLPPKFALADLATVMQIFEHYVKDPRNLPHSAKNCELEVRAVIAGDIHLKGHLDQTRVARDGVDEVWDVKNGQPSPEKMIGEYAWQQCGYVVAYHQTTGREVRHGGLIRTRSYLQPSQGDPFVQTGWTLEQCYRVLESAAFIIKNIRAGKVPATPGAHCSYCAIGDPVKCLEM